LSGQEGGISRIRVVIGTAGGLLLAFGVFRLLTEIPGRGLLGLALWLGGALVLHDALLSPGIVGVGSLLRRVPARARTYVQGALIAGGLVTVIAIPLIYRTGSQAPAEAILEQDFRTNLAVLLAVVSVVAVAAYLGRVARERRAHGPAGSGDDRRAEGHTQRADHG
jgi:hypothetical protein